MEIAIGKMENESNAMWARDMLKAVQEVLERNEPNFSTDTKAGGALESAICAFEKAFDAGKWIEWHER